MLIEEARFHKIYYISINYSNIYYIAIDSFNAYITKMSKLFCDRLLLLKYFIIKIFVFFNDDG